PLNVNGGLVGPPFPIVHNQLLCLAHVEGEVVFLAPHCQVSDLLPIGSLIIVGDQAYYCVVCKLRATILSLLMCPCLMPSFILSMFPGNESLTRSYLEGEVASGVSSNYSLCLAAYALSLANSLTAGTALDELKRRADIRGNLHGVQIWRSSSAEVSDSWQPRSAEIEMAAYVLLALYKRASVVEAISLMKWLSQQRNHLGAYGSTQDTVVALQALSVYAAFSGADAIELGVEVSTSVSPTVSHFNINSTNYLVHQSKEVDAEQDLLINVFMEGRGFALFQVLLLIYHWGGSVA
ncbi:unnamed protein product, partial [Oncorhynchus mykiss]